MEASLQLLRVPVKLIGPLAVVLFGVTLTARAQNIPFPPAGSTAFIDVNLVPMDSERVVPHQTVIVRERKIVTIGESESTAVPAGVLRIEGGGKLYLMPGLADMHSHAYEQDDLTLYIANGVTTILTLGGTPDSFISTMRKRIVAGQEIGPTPYISF